MTNDLQEILLDEETIHRRVIALGEEIDEHYVDEEILLITLLDGAIVFTADLIRNLRRPLRLDCIRVSSYGDSAAPESAPRILDHLRAEVEDRHVLLVDDILDTGRTLQEARRIMIEEMGAAEVLCVVLVDKPIRRAVPIEADDRVLTLEEDLFLVGCGLDFAGRFRNLPDLRALESDEV